MKKFMKAIAFVTVMCMALSTVAFAANEGTAVQDTTDYKQVNVTVTGAAVNEQVALLIVAKDADISTATPLYIDQKPAVAQGDGAVASFEAPLTVADGIEVDVHVGYASNTSGKAIKVGTVKLDAPITEVTVAKTNAQILESNNGVGATFTVTAPDGVKAASMIWAIKYEKDGNATYMFSDEYTLEDYDIGGVIANGSAVTLGLAFQAETGVTIEAVDAIFFFEGKDPVVTAEDLWNYDNKDDNDNN